jgi:hypothetical protein
MSRKIVLTQGYQEAQKKKKRKEKSKKERWGKEKIIRSWTTFHHIFLYLPIDT